MRCTCFLKIAQIDKSEYCFLPAHSYIIMVIYFLQRTSPPVLPVLHDLQQSGKRTAATLKTSLSVDINSILLSTSPSKTKHSVKKKSRRISTNTAGGGDLDTSVTESNEDESEKNFDSFRTNILSYVILYEI